MTITPTRFAGPITTEPGVVDETSPVVILNIMGSQADLFPDEAVRLAVRLIEAAAKSEAPAPDDWTEAE